MTFKPLAWIIPFVVALVLGQSQTVEHLSPSTPQRLFESALEKDRAGDVAGAITAYQRVLALTKGDRAMVAIAMVKLAACYRHTADTQARELYERVLREYTDQSDAAAEALEGIADLSGTRRPSSTLVWKGKKVNVQGSVSPNGRYISFVDWDTGDLSLHDVATDKDRPVVAANNPKRGRWNFFAEESTISRDGTKVAYSWFDNSKDRYELWIANLYGVPKPRRLYENPKVAWLAPRDWSPDGRWLTVLVASKNNPDQLALVSVDDGTMRVLKAGHWPGNTRIFFSPDGKYLAYDLPQGPTSARDVWVTAVDGTKDSAVVSHRGHDVIMGWSPDGMYLLFASHRTGSMALWSLPMRNGTPHGAPEMLKPDMGFTESMGVTRAGTLFYGTQVGRRGGSIQIASFDLQSGAVSSPRDVSTAPQENNTNPSYSPDGKYLAYVSERGRRGATPIFVLRAADTGGMVREIEAKLQLGEIAGWEPNSKALLAVGEDFNGRRGAFRIGVETGELSFLFAAPGGPTLSMPTWSRDGQSIYYWNRVSGGTEQVFMAHDLASGAEKELIRKPFLGQLNLSPDGRNLATETIDVATNERVLLLIPLDAGTPREIMRVASAVPPEDLKTVGKGARVAPASWAPDSLSFIARLQHAPEAESELWQVPIDGTLPRKLPSLLDAHVFAFKISPDGRHVTYRIKEPDPPPPPQVWKFEHFVPATSARAGNKGLRW